MECDNEAMQYSGKNDPSWRKYVNTCMRVPENKIFFINTYKKYHNPFSDKQKIIYRNYNVMDKF